MTMQRVPIALLSLIMALPCLGTSQASEPVSGKKLFEGKCSICHGKDGKPKEAAGKAHRFTDASWQKTITREDIEKIITEGRERDDKKMPPFREKLSPEEIKSIAGYVKSFGDRKK